jgi:hypothetical protein
MYGVSTWRFAILCDFTRQLLLVLPFNSIKFNMEREGETLCILHQDQGTPVV